MRTRAATAAMYSRAPHRSPASESGRRLAGTVEAKASGVVMVEEALLRGGVVVVI
jgi:hypothetical protein